jgi:AcrR family transcriptional regulator
MTKRQRAHLLNSAPRRAAVQVAARWRSPPRKEEHTGRVIASRYYQGPYFHVWQRCQYVEAYIYNFGCGRIAKHLSGVGLGVPRILTESDVADFRERLCEVATEIYIEKGLEGLNMRELAARLGISAMTPYRYFKDKDEILSAIRTRAFNRFADRLEKTMAENGGPAEKNDAVARAYLRFALEQSCCYRLMFDLSCPRLEPVPELLAAERRARAVLTGHARAMVKEGFFHGDPELIGPVLWSALHGLATLHLAGALAEGEFDPTRSEIMRIFTGAYMVP